ncbi:MAG TPA: hypothetical protein VK179_18730 [Bacteroidales bacterium]|nr:hypothetical protein [Bacteroidales bacterium]
MRYKLAIILLICLVIPLKAQVPEYSQHVSRAFRVTSNTSVEISNKYGKVQVIPWEQDSVKFSIDLRIKAKDKQKLEKMKQNVDFEFVPGQSFLIARTKFGDAGSDVFKDLMDIAGSYLSSSNSVIINYTVMIPSWLTIKIENRFGDVYLEDHSGAVNILLSYGDLRADRLNGRSEIKITSGDADINFLKDGNLIVSYVNMHIHETPKLNLQSQSSVLTIEKTGNLKINSRRDKLYLTDANYLSGQSYFSNINLGVLNNEITLSSRYGNINAENIKRSFSGININSELTDISLSFERPVAFDFDLTHYQLVNFMYPNSIAKLSTKVIDPEEKVFSTTGTFGSGSGDSYVTIKALRKSDVTISQH